MTLLKGTVCNWVRRKRKKIKPRSVSKSSRQEFSSNRHGVTECTNNKINKEDRSVENTVIRYLTYVRLKIHIYYIYIYVYISFLL